MRLGRPPGNDNCQKMQIAGDECVEDAFLIEVARHGRHEHCRARVPAIVLKRWQMWVGSKDPSQGITREVVWPLARHCLVLPIPASVYSGTLIWPLRKALRRSSRTVPPSPAQSNARESGPYRRLCAACSTHPWKARKGRRGYAGRFPHPDDRRPPRRFFHRLRRCPSSACAWHQRKPGVAVREDQPFLASLRINGEDLRFGLFRRTKAETSNDCAC